MNWSAAEVAEVPTGVVTVTSTAPPAFDEGQITVGCESLATARFVAAAEPKLTPVAPAKPLPVTVTLSPPAADPLAG
jgi:hypothetical protein